MHDVHFKVCLESVAGMPGPVVGVDGPVKGADALYDHHATGEPVNLLAVPDHPIAPGTLATTMLDGDAVISAAAVLLRAAGRHSEVMASFAVLHEAAHWCDWLAPSGKFSESAEQEGLGLHCWLKSQGMQQVRESAPPRGSSVDRGVAVDSTFRALSLALARALLARSLPCDYRYLDRLAHMAALARAASRRKTGRVTVVKCRDYVDPLALYTTIHTDLCLRHSATGKGRHIYSLGVHPRAYRRVDLRPVLAELSAMEPGWGGRAVAGGSPLGCGSKLPLETVLAVMDCAA